MNLGNPMLNQLNSQQGGLSLKNRQQVKQMVNMIKSSKNPNLLLQQMLNNNPNFKNVIQYINQNGGDPKTAFYKMAEEKGVDPNEILNILK